MRGVKFTRIGPFYPSQRIAKFSLQLPGYPFACVCLVNVVCGLDPAKPVSQAEPQGEAVALLLSGARVFNLGENLRYRSVIEALSISVTLRA